MKSAQKGFTLAELLIALALLGIIAAFTIPKVLQAAGTQETTAKVREMVSTMESAYHALRIGSRIQYGTNLYGNLIGSLNTVTTAAGAIPATLAANNPQGEPHPCVTAGGGTLDPSLGYVVFANGAFMSGLASNTDGGANADGTLDSAIWSDASHTFSANYILCMDVNGPNAPNLAGTDVFFGNFNQYGGFTGVPPGETARAFRWGSTTDNVLHNGAAAVWCAGCGTAVTPLATGDPDDWGDGSIATSSVVGRLLIGG